MRDGCDQLSGKPATLKIWKPGCLKPIRTCVGCNPCGGMVWKVTYPTRQEITIQSSETEGGGRIKFALPQTFFDMGVGRLDGSITLCGKTTPVAFQVFDSPEVVEYNSGAYRTTVSYTVGGVVVGELAVLKANCRIPQGFVAVLDEITCNVIGYARSYKSMGFCKRFSLTGSSCRVVYLK
jgi:hypothetical protein